MMFVTVKLTARLNRDVLVAHLEEGIVIKGRLRLTADLVHDLHCLDWEAACCRLATAATKKCSAVYLVIPQNHVHSVICPYQHYSSIQGHQPEHDTVGAIEHCIGDVCRLCTRR